MKRKSKRPLVNYRVMASEFAEHLRPTIIIGRVPHYRYRSAKTGLYVSKRFADRHPNTTVRERI